MKKVLMFINIAVILLLPVLFTACHKAEQKTYVPNKPANTAIDYHSKNKRNNSADKNKNNRNSEKDLKVVERRCEACRGKGSFMCSNCYEKGYVYKWVEDEKVKVTCDWCKGEGRVECSNCFGKGMVWP